MNPNDENEILIVLKRIEKIINIIEFIAITIFSYLGLSIFFPK